VDARENVFELLTTWSRGRRNAEELLDERSPRDRAFVQELFYGCLRQRLALDFLISRMAGKAPRRAVATILEIGLYQLLFMRVPAHAAVHEAVELAKKHASPAEAKFVNAVLRHTDPAMLAKAEPWVRLSHPRWLWERHGDAWCEWNNSPPPVYVRRNTLVGAGSINRSLLSRLEIAPAGKHSLCFEVRNPRILLDSEEWQQGEFYVQDPSTLIAVDTLDPQPGESVLDLCAAPGGKTTYIAQKMQNRGQIVAADSSNMRLALVTENCQRLRVSIVATLVCDAGRCLRGRQFDRVLVDAPCSNTGVLRRRVDLRWRIRQEELPRLAGLQAKLLAAAGGLTKPGGVLVYSTCSLEPEENERVVEQFRWAHPQFLLETTRSSVPPRDGMDGAFVVRWRRL
jgi:16S rRNA (cytosine967-C5)-methyltransferase